LIILQHSPQKIASLLFQRSFIPYLQKWDFFSSAHNHYVSTMCFRSVTLNQLNIFQCAFGIIFPIIKAEGIRQVFFPTSIPAFYRAPPDR